MILASFGISISRPFRRKMRSALSVTSATYQSVGRLELGIISLQHDVAPQWIMPAASGAT